MKAPAQFSYSLKFSTATIALMVIFLAIVFHNLSGNNTAFVWLIAGFCSLVFISLSAAIVSRRLLPAIKGDVALQIDDEGISDFVKEISIEWKDIENIELVRGRSASIMQVNLKWETDYGSQIAIYLRWVKGRDKEIFETSRLYFEHYKHHYDS